MKKLSFAIVLMATGVTFANAQSTDAVKNSTKVDTTAKAEVVAKPELQADTAVLAPVSEIKAAPVEAEKAEAKKEATIDRQKARVEKKAPIKTEAKKLVE